MLAVFEMAFVVLVISFLVTQVIVPIVTRIDLFPMFRVFKNQNKRGRV